MLALKPLEVPRLFEEIARVLKELCADAGDEAATIALSHHEKWDGSGYPNKLAGDDIPHVERLVAIADVFDALTCARPYKPAWSNDDAVALIERGSGAHSDPDSRHRFPGIFAIHPECARTLGRCGRRVVWRPGGF